METNNTEKQYRKIFNEIREEKMNWDFDDFLKETEKEKLIKPQKKDVINMPKIFWLAASLILLASMFMIFKYINKRQSVEETEHIVKNNVLKQNDKPQKNEVLAQTAAQNSMKDSLKNVEKDSAVKENQVYEKDILDQILPKRGRLRKQHRERYVQNSSNKDRNSSAKNSIENTNYQSTYVVVNGKKIEDENQAIDITKEAFKVLASNVTETINQTETIKNLSIDF